MRSRSKRERWAENAELECVHEPDLSEVAAGRAYLRGRWAADHFGDEAPLTLELGCGQGLFAVDLARRFPDRSHVGVDVKGHRFWRGARLATDEGVRNAAFLRARIQWLDRFFGPGEVSEIWVTFSDPQLADKRGTKRLVSPFYLRLYQHVLAIGGVVRVKTDSPEFAEHALEAAAVAGMEVVDHSGNVHGEPEGRFDPELTCSLAFITAFEERWIKEGRRIHYVELRKVAEVAPADLAEAQRMLQGPTERVSPRVPGGLPASAD